MPLWRIFHPPHAFTPAQKSHLATSITTVYAGIGLPAFYVNVFFISLPPTDIYIGGVPRDNFIRICIEHIARTFPVPEDDVRGRRKGFCDRVDEVLNGFMQEGGWDWEYHVSDTPRDLWKINGLVPPPEGSEGEREWKDGGRPVGWGVGDGVTGD